MEVVNFYSSEIKYPETNELSPDCHHTLNIIRMTKRYCTAELQVNLIAALEPQIGQSVRWL